jgi:CRP-like cAMP-binding protein
MGASREKTMSKPTHLSFKTNHLLAALPENEYQRLLPSMETISFAVSDGLYELDKLIEYVYFPLSGLASILVTVDCNDGNDLIEAAIVGNEGMVGLPLSLGVDHTNSVSFYQIAGEVARMPSEAFTAEMDRNEIFRDIVQRYTHAYMAMLAQNTGCNSQHTLNQRCARWLLHVHDCVEGEQFALKQEFLSQMLGVRRAGVSEVMGRFQKAGFIHYSRGIITIVDRVGLNRAACACYDIITDQYDHMLDN